MSKKFFYFDIHYAVVLHDWIINNSGGLAGINNLGLLEAPLAHIQNDDYYPELEDKLTHLVFSVNKSHAFMDGNKRSSIELGCYFLKINGYDYVVKKFVLEMENIAVWVAEGLISKNLLGEIVKSLIYEDDYSESLKLKIFLAVQPRT
ncbi:type II toxin-antitoxin system death-on-curing family toxin [Pseudanabaena galeata UHCC 0370]|uniref:Type II toxin-antitoxin system death-on-curing family toxin n=1 Tax=Pseudanabaena galeata UHCC 0370 TaxID=3110310 RepID=A0ABU5TGM9_9CYAN|nr:type II toxin-antitoxin system death-on-curing family toxin [Pseudanabaena galeata]MEA5477231.1 type II toxin-antitoxin system death-on-curing family toxin [Pseudanabaena galeata UHCC 0370]